MHVVERTDDLVELVKSLPQIRVTAGGTKPAASHDAAISLTHLSGVLNYDPGELTFTALAGTSIDQVEAQLAENGQYLPFDPPLADHGATLGGTVACGLSGAGRYRYGGVKDFLLGAKVVTGQGKVVTTGSRVVKNSAGFDFPKLMVGALGCLGIMTELTFKVFPQPERSATVVFEPASLSEAVELLSELAASHWDFACLDLDAERRIWARLSGFHDSAPHRAQRVLQSYGTAVRVLVDEQDASHWRDCREFKWLPADCALVKIAITPKLIEKLWASLHDLPLRFSVGGNLAWLGWPEHQNGNRLDRTLREIGCAGLFVTGKPLSPFVGRRFDSAFAERLQAAVDPHSKFVIGDRTK